MFEVKNEYVKTYLDTWLNEVEEFLVKPIRQFENKKNFLETRRVLLPEKIIEAQNEGILYFHDAEYFVQPIINSSIINIPDMFENGYVINNIFNRCIGL